MAFFHSIFDSSLEVLATHTWEPPCISPRYASSLSDPWVERFRGLQNPGRSWQTLDWIGTACPLGHLVSRFTIDPLGWIFWKPLQGSRKFLCFGWESRPGLQGQVHVWRTGQITKHWLAHPSPYRPPAYPWPPWHCGLSSCSSVLFYLLFKSWEWQLRALGDPILRDLW